MALKARNFYLHPPQETPTPALIIHISSRAVFHNLLSRVPALGQMIYRGEEEPQSISQELRSGGAGRSKFSAKERNSFETNYIPACHPPLLRALNTQLIRRLFKEREREKERLLLVILTSV